MDISDQPSASMRAHRILVMTRFPEPGRTKTRLIPALGPERAASLHHCLIEGTLRVALSMQESASCDIEVHYTGSNENAFRAAFGDQLRYVPQADGSLGERMSGAMNRAFEEGATRVVVIGTDCPGLRVDHLTTAFERLTRADVVLGPATDGGYYLVGTRHPVPPLFECIDWGTERVLQQTLRQAATARAVVSQLSPLSDVDTAEDLIQCRRMETHFDAVLPRCVPGRISIIIPTLNEAMTIRATLKRLLNTDNTEIIVADGGSDDETVELAQNEGVTVVSCSPGRGQQLNAGAALASGEVLLFLHSDTRLPDDFQTQVRQSLQNGDSGGAFRLSIEGAGWLLILVAFGANLRSRWLQMPYGDQAIFVPAATFYALEGFRNIPLMEDYEFCRRLRRVGQIGQLPSSVVTSARRWQRLGVFRTTLINWICVLAFRLGVSARSLNTWYRRKR